MGIRKYIIRVVAFAILIILVGGPLVALHNYGTMKTNPTNTTKYEEFLRNNNLTNTSLTRTIYRDEQYLLMTLAMLTPLIIQLYIAVSILTITIFMMTFITEEKLSEKTEKTFNYISWAIIAGMLVYAIIKYYPLIQSLR